jgi:hypothetical protein
MEAPMLTQCPVTPFRIPHHQRVLRYALRTLLLVFALAGDDVVAQDFRGAIQGRVTDNSGASVPGVTVTALNLATNAVSTTTTNENGNYSVPFLPPGQYKITAELQGFKKTERDHIDVRIGDRLGLDLVLELGGIEEVVSVTASTPLLDTRSGSTGQVIDEKRLALMPLSDGNPFVLTRLATGIAYTGDLKFSRPFDNGGTSDVASNGGARQGNEFTLDGVPNTTGTRVAFVPPAGAVQEFKVETANFDAQQGHSGGATINVTMKSGTNLLKGEGYYQYRDEKLSANDFFLDRAGQPKAPLDYKRFGGYGGGPIIKNKTFLFSAVEWLYDEFPEPNQYTVPTAKQRNGDFSELLTQGITIYDPASARLENGRIVRDAFPGNVIPQGRLNPVGQKYVSYYPLPNQSGDAQGKNNYLTSNPRSDDFYSISTRVDHQFNDRQKMFVRYARNDRTESRGNWTGTTNDVLATGNFLSRKNDALSVDHVWTMSSSTLLNVKGSWSRFQEPNRRQSQGTFDLANLGFSSATIGQFDGASYFPRFDMPDGSYSEMGDSYGNGTNTQIYAVQPTLTRIMGNHSLRGGYDFRLYRQTGAPDLHLAGIYTFDSVYTKATDSAAASPIGQDLAAVLLGIPSSGRIERTADADVSVPYHGVFVQDDWRVSNKLTINVGLRYEYEGAPREKDNRNVAGFDPNAALAITGAAQAAYARNPIPQIAPADFRVLGGIRYATDSSRGFYRADRNNIQPRFGVAYQLNDATVARGGWGLYTVPANVNGIWQPGYLQTTNFVPTNDNGLSFVANMTNPFPGGVLDPVGAAQGADTYVGRALTEKRFHMNADDVANPQMMRWVASLQRQLPGQWVVEGTYVGAKGYDLTTEIEGNPLPNQYLSTSAVRDQATIDFLQAIVPNPLQGLVPGTSLNGSTVQRQQLLRLYPQFQNINTYGYAGSNSYQSGQLRVEKRFSGGYTVLSSYTYSVARERISRLNAGDASYERRPSQVDVPHRFVLNGIWELPFGRDRRFLKDANGAVNALAGNWSVAATYQYQSGVPLCANTPCILGNSYYDGDINKLTADYSGAVDQPVFDTGGFYFHDATVQTNGADDPVKQRTDRRIQLTNNLRTFPSRSSSLRGPAQNFWDLSFVKALPFAGRFRAQLHFELYNAFNQVFYSTPNLDPTNANFGRVTQQSNLPRNFQIGMKLAF